MNIVLLTHQREVFKKTNTGTLVTELLREKAKIVIWERTTPNLELLEEIEQGRVALLYPSEDSQVVSTGSDFETYIILDGTWQEAQKMYNKSPYLKALPKVRIETARPSIYHLRRNQKANGLCTVECAIELLKAKKFKAAADELQQKLIDFMEET